MTPALTSSLREPERCRNPRPVFGNFRHASGEPAASRSALSLPLQAARLATDLLAP